MSWIESINTDFKITTGDTAQYFPKWFNAKLGKNFNLSEFNFKGVAGTLVDRRLPQGRTFPVEIVFDGAECFEIAKAFNKSADNPKAWTIEHPVYGQIVVQPKSLELDNTSFNVSRFFVQLIETIGTKALITGTSAPEKIIADAKVTQQKFTDTLAAEIPVPPASTLRAMTIKVNNLYSSISDAIAEEVDYTAFTNAYNQANAFISATEFDVTALVAQIQDVAAFPADFIDTVYNRLTLLVTQFGKLFTNATAPQNKRLYENNAGTSVLSMCVAAVTNYDYVTRTNVLNAVTVIVDTYNTYLANLDTIQTLNGGDLDSYIPDADSVTSLTDLVRYTVASLFDIATSAKQERTLYTAEDINVIELAFQIYGLLPDDSTIDTLIADNDIGEEEILQIQKGRKIVYNI